MAHIQFPCSSCRATLAVASEFAGRVVACPRCKERTTAPTPFEVVEDTTPPKQAFKPPERQAVQPPAVPAPEPRKLVKAEVEESSEERVRFPCGGCGAKMAVVASRRGQSVECPKCGDRTLVPDEEEVGTYGLAGASKKGTVKKAKSPPLAAWWPDGGKLRVPATWAADLARARSHAERSQWKQALSVLHNLQKRGKVNDIDEAHVLHKPLAYCLGRWAADELDRLDAKDALSKPMRKLFKKARESQMWAGSFTDEMCPLCDRTLRSIIGTTQIRTVAGSAYVCCASPTSADLELVAKVHKINLKLTIASGLDGGTPEVANALADIPSWYRGIDLNEPWWARSVREGAGGSAAEGGILGDILGDALGDALGGLLS